MELIFPSLTGGKINKKINESYSYFADKAKGKIKHLMQSSSKFKSRISSFAVGLEAFIIVFDFRYEHKDRIPLRVSLSSGIRDQKRDSGFIGSLDVERQTINTSVCQSIYK